MKFSCEINEEVQKEVNKTSKFYSILSLVIGAIGIFAYIVISVFVEHVILDILLWVFAFLLVFGILFLVSINKVNKTTVDKKMIDEYELFETYLTVDSFQNGEKIVSIKTYYKDIIKIKETENYLFLYPNKQGAYPVPKSKLSSEELDKLKQWLKAEMNKKNKE